MAEDSARPSPMSASAPHLPALSPSPQQTFKSKATERQMAAQERRMRAGVEAPKRQEFLGGLLNQDLQQISKWHGSRPHHEQKRFVRAVDSLYKGFSKMDKTLPKNEARMEKEYTQAAKQQAEAMAAAQALLNRDDPYLRESPRGQPMAQSSSAPNLTKPIDVFEQNKKGRRRGSGASGAGSDAGSVAQSYGSQGKNGLEKWLDAQSTTTYTTQASTATQETSLSQMTRTTASGMSECSEPGTHNQQIYRWHKRAFAASKRRFDAKDQHAPAYLKDGIPNIGFPECERMATNYRDQFGYNGGIGGGEIHPQAYRSVFKDEKIPFVEQFLETAPKDEKNQVAGMVRSLQYLRLAHHRNTSCVMRQEMDLAENSKLWKPKKQEQVFRPDQRNVSRVPLGAPPPIDMSIPRVKPETPPPGTPSIYSPSVSGLGSLPLTPRSIATPLVGGRDFTMMSAPDMPLAPIAEGSY